MRQAPDVAVRATGSVPGRREQNKRDKLERLREAARALFLERGYDNATTREIAQRAGIGMGTLFAYARDKRDLLFLIFNDQLETMAAALFRGSRPAKPLDRQLADSFRPFYAFFAGQPDLARFMLRELEFYNSGPQAQRFRAARDLLLTELAGQIRAWQQGGRVKPGISPDAAARAVLAIYAASVRDFLAVPQPDVEAGLQTLRFLLGLLLDGLTPPQD